LFGHKFGYNSEKQFNNSPSLGKHCNQEEMRAMMVTHDNYLASNIGRMLLLKVVESQKRSWGFTQESVASIKEARPARKCQNTGGTMIEGK
jgi:hypothetical protein